MDIFDRVEQANTVDELVQLEKDAGMQIEGSLQRLQDIKREIEILIDEKEGLKDILYNVDPRDLIKRKIGEIIIESHRDS